MFGAFLLYLDKMTVFNINTASILLSSRVGFRQTVAKKEYLDIDSALLPDIATGGEFVNSLSEKFLSVETMDNVLVDNDGFDVDTWDVGKAYIIGDRVRKIINDRTFTWTAKTNNTGNDPELDTGTNWKSTLSEVLENYRNSAAIEIMGRAISKQNNGAGASGLRISTTMYKERATPTPVQLKSRFVATCIKPINNMLNKVITIDRIGLNITGATGNFAVHLFHSSRREALQTFIINVDIAAKLNTHVWYSLIDSIGNPLVIDMFDQDFNQGGVFYLGFFEDELAGNGQSYNFNELSTIFGPTRSIARSAWPGFNSGVIFSDDSFALGSVEIQNNKLNGLELPDIGQFYDGPSYNSELPMNLQFRIEQSYFPQIELNIGIFQEAYKYLLGTMILRDMMQNDRINRISDNAEVKIDELLFGDPANDANNGLVAVKEGHVKKLLTDLDVIFDDFKGPYLGPI